MSQPAGTQKKQRHLVGTSTSRTVAGPERLLEAVMLFNASPLFSAL
jgi:hypothetical protein